MRTVLDGAFSHADCRVMRHNNLVPRTGSVVARICSEPNLPSDARRIDGPLVPIATAGTCAPAIAGGGARHSEDTDPPQATTAAGYGGEVRSADHQLRPRAKPTHMHTRLPSLTPPRGARD